MKKYGLGLLIMLLLLTGCATQNQGATGFEWEVKEGSAWLTGIGSAKETDIMIPAQVCLRWKNGRWQESLWGSVFGDEESTYPVIVAGDAFYDCDQIVTVTFQDGVAVQSNTMTVQSKGMFARCDNLTGVYNIPNSVTNMYGTFIDCKSLETISNFPEDVTLLYDCFRGCSALTSVPRLPDGVQSMFGTFMDCTSLVTAPDIPESVTSLTNCFQGCTSLSTVIHLPEGIQEMESCFENCVSLTQVPDIPTSVKSLMYTFRNCTSLKATPRMPNTLRNLASAFEGCTALETVTNIPDEVSVMSCTFAGCIALKDVPPLPDHYITMFGCFRDCISLEGSISMHWEYVYAHGMVGVFDNCTNLDTIFINCCPFCSAITEDEYETEVVYTGIHEEGAICPWCGHTFAFTYVDDVIVGYENASNAYVEWFIDLIDNEIPGIFKEYCNSITLTDDLMRYTDSESVRKPTVNGFASGGKAYIKIRESFYSMEYTVYHELGHCLDSGYIDTSEAEQTNVWKLSDTEEWIALHEAEGAAASYWYNLNSYWSFTEEERRRETFAISVGKYFTAPNALKASCPGMYEYMDNLFREALEAEATAKDAENAA